MISIKRTNAQDPDFIKLVDLLNAELAGRDGATHPLAQFNDISELKHVVLAMNSDEAVGCGAILAYDDESIEIKRMYVSPAYRGQRIGEKLLLALEHWSKELDFSTCVLFTGAKQPEANRLYQSNGYELIGPYGKLMDIPDSLCYSKVLQ